jgi:hypothetical protein
MKVRGSPGGQGGLEFLGESPESYKRLYESRARLAKGVDGSDRAHQGFHTRHRLRTGAALRPIAEVDGVLKFLAIEWRSSNTDGYWTRAERLQHLPGTHHCVMFHIRSARRETKGWQTEVGGGPSWRAVSVPPPGLPPDVTSAGPGGFRGGRGPGRGPGGWRRTGTGSAGWPHRDASKAVAIEAARGAWLFASEYTRFTCAISLRSIVNVGYEVAAGPQYQALIAVRCGRRHAQVVFDRRIHFDLQRARVCSPSSRAARRSFLLR